MEGPKLIEMLQNHILEVMQQIPQCQPGSSGTSNKEIEEAAGLALNLPYQDGWLTWSILHSLINKGLVEAVEVKHGKTKRFKYRLTRGNNLVSNSNK
ncbi:hypothetical protein [Caldicellulosiruptor acetigenus]|uniref:Uncharacterized protein n=1 Tax=Caldicellulosiruptor acetigenus 6A TaxID=632516 RepID=G2PT74_9FIRM|nr:hypothetical protein [Caldicellulosiruptor acetigenus]AEM74233.1 hypothetical protein Calla_1632 [Caldicellulosiruptor acetigenus 6A]